MRDNGDVDDDDVTFVLEAGWNGSKPVGLFIISFID